ncbi:MAG: hypothetical protein PVF73_12945, partial [Bacteroidales bacterium]
MNAIKTNNVLVTIIFLIFEQVVICQNADNGGNNFIQSSPVTPEVASFMRFIEMPVSYYTGTIDVSIPLYSIKQDGIDIPVELKYHNAGMKVAEEASWVGLGWDLTVGGVIFRQVRGNPDDIWDGGYIGWLNNLDKIVNFPTYSDCPSCGFSDNYAILPFTCPSSITYGSNCPSVIDEDYENFRLGYYDTEPDEFTFSFPGQSGKFSFDKNGQVVKQGKNALIITPVFGTGNEIQSFIITDESGNKYTFSKKQRSYLWSLTGASSPWNPPKPQIWYTSAWFLECIVTNKGNTITFEYYPEGANVLALSIFSQAKEVLNSTDAFIPCTETVNEYTPVYLQEVTFDQGYIKFNLSGTKRIDIQNAYRLANIEIYDFNDNLKKKFILDNNHYFTATSNSSNEVDLTGHKYELLLMTLGGYNSSTISAAESERICKRLKLNKITEYDANGNSLSPYQFTYNSTNLPPKTSFAVDFWGYYNGVISNTSYIPSVADYFDYFYYTNPTVLYQNKFLVFNYGDRNASNNGMACMLTNVTYPTKGELQIEYELNRFINFQDFQEYEFSNYSSGLIPLSLTSTTNFTTDNYDKYGETTINVVQRVNTSPADCECDRYKIRITDNTGTIIFSSPLNEFCDQLSVPLSWPCSFNSYFDIPTLQGNKTYQISIIDLKPNTCTDQMYNGVTSTFQILFTYKNIIPKTEGIGGGFRVKQFSNYDPVQNKTIVKTLTYNNGILATYPKFCRVATQSFYYGSKYCFGGTCDPYNTGTLANNGVGYNILDYYPGTAITLYAFSNLTASGAFNGSHVGYTDVYVNTTENGKTYKSQYNYYNEEQKTAGELTGNDYDFATLLPVIPIFTNGTLKCKTDFNANNISVKTTTYGYTPEMEQNSFGAKFIHATSTDGCICFFSASMTFYKLYTYWNRLDIVTEIQDGVTKVTEYTYNPDYYQISGI